MENSLEFLRPSNRGLIVLNAFRHQWKIHVDHLLSVQLYSGAQRLSASMENSLFNAFPIMVHALLCSTPFGINGKFTGTDVEKVDDLYLCSTPFGINGKFTALLECRRVPATKCSTPFGINGKFTLLGRSRQAELVGAQRLSASMENSPHALLPFVL